MNEREVFTLLADLAELRKQDSSCYTPADAMQIYNCFVFTWHKLDQHTDELTEAFGQSFLDVMTKFR